MPKRRYILFFLALVTIFCFPKLFIKSRSLAISIASKPVRVSGQVIYREPAFWSSHLWISDGKAQGVQVNTTVLKDGALIGLVDLVEAKKSRVRLLTDSGLVPSVRVKRGKDHERLLNEQVKTLINNLALSGEDHTPLNHLLKTLKKRTGETYLAKGELRGTSQALWRSCSQTLKGVGFNYDFPDEYGKARDLTSDLIKEGDLLVTTGLDGVFPKELPVAIVSRVFPLKEGAVTYDIEAKMVAGNLDEVDSVSLILNTPN